MLKAAMDNPLKTDSKSDNAFETAREKTRGYARRLWDIVATHSKIQHLGENEPTNRVSPAPFRYKNKWLLHLLSLVPYFLAVIFLVSFYWDFDGVQWQLLGNTYEAQGLLKILSVSGMIGFLTNWLAITMLFKPSRKRPVLGHGLVPAQKDRIAFRLAQAVSDDLINPAIIKQKINESQIISRYREQSSAYIKSIIDDPGFRRDLKEWVVHYVEEMIADPEIRTAIAEKILLQIEHALEDKSIEKVALKAYSFVKGREMQEIVEEALVRIPGSVETGLDKLDLLLDRLPEKLDEHSEVIENVVTSLLYKLVNQLDVHTLVEDNLRNYDEQQLSLIIQKATNEQLRYIQYLGAVLGTVGGFVIWEPVVSLAFLSLAGLFILLLDMLLFHYA